MSQWRDEVVMGHGGPQSSDEIGTQDTGKIREAAAMYPLPVPEARSPRWVWAGPVRPGALRGHLSQASLPTLMVLAVLGVPWPVDASPRLL